MNGQWIGEYTGTSSGVLIVNVDEMRSVFEGVAYLMPNGNEVPLTGVGFRTIDKEREFRFSTARLWAIHPYTKDAAKWDDVKQFYPAGFAISNNVEVSGRWDGNHLHV